MKRMVLVLAVAFATAAIYTTAAVAGTGGSGTQADPYGPGDHIPICHLEGEGAEASYVYIEPSATAGGPAGHEGHGDDIFEGYWFKQNANADTVFVEGQNEDMAVLLETECVEAAGTTGGGDTTATTGGGDTTAAAAAATTGGGGAGGGGGGGGGSEGGGGSGELPFTGLPVLIPLLLGGALLASGAALLRRGRQED